MSIRRFSQSEIEALLQGGLEKGLAAEALIGRLHTEKQIGTMFLWPAVAAVLGIERHEAMRMVVRATRSFE